MLKLVYCMLYIHAWLHAQTNGPIFVLHHAYSINPHALKGRNQSESLTLIYDVHVYSQDLSGNFSLGERAQVRKR